MTCKKCATKFMPAAVVSNMAPPLASPFQSVPPAYQAAPPPFQAASTPIAQQPPQPDIVDLGISVYVPPPRSLAKRRRVELNSLWTGVFIGATGLLVLLVFLARAMRDDTGMEFKPPPILVPAMIIFGPMALFGFLSRLGYLSVGRWLIMGAFCFLTATALGGAAFQIRMEGEDYRIAKELAEIAAWCAVGCVLAGAIHPKPRER